MKEILWGVLALVLLSVPSFADIASVGEPVIGEYTGTTTIQFGKVYIMQASQAVAGGPGTIVAQRPVISDIYVGDRFYHKDLVEKGEEKYYVASKTSIRATIKSSDGIDTKKIALSLKNASGVTTNFNITDANISSKIEKASVVTQCDISYDVAGLTAGDNTVTITAQNAGGYASETLKLAMTSGKGVIGDVVVYPSPFSIEKDGTAYIQYTLLEAADVQIYITAVGGVVIKKITCHSGQEEGGKAGRNKVPWDGRSDSGDLTGNGIYVGTLVSDGKILKKFKFTVKN